MKFINKVTNIPLLILSVILLTATGFEVHQKYVPSTPTVSTKETFNPTIPKTLPTVPMANNLIGWSATSPSQAKVPTQTPVISVNDKGDDFTIKLSPGAKYSCTVYWEIKVTEKDSKNFPDGHYAPRHCLWLSPTQTTYQDDWDYIVPAKTDWNVWAEVQYEAPDGSFPTLKSNVVKVRF